MSYCFEPTDPSVQAGLRRIAREQLQGAARALRGPGAATKGVHEARKALKKTRALLRLVRHGLPGFRRENRVLRDIGRGLAPLRDADVMAGLLGRLCDDTEIPDRAGIKLAAADSCAPADPAAALTQAADDLDAAAERAAGWTVRGEALDVLARGLENAAARCLAAMEAALEGRDAERLHAFRKRVKERWYHARLMAATWPEAMAIEVAAADALAERLGDRHDLDVLAARLCGPVPPALQAVMTERSGRLMSEIRPLARRLCAERPASFSDRRIGWWRTADPALPSG